MKTDKTADYQWPDYSVGNHCPHGLTTEGPCPDCTAKRSEASERNAARGNEGSEMVALRALIKASEHLIKEMEFAFDDVPAGVDAWMSNLRVAIADARQQI